MDSKHSKDETKKQPHIKPGSVAALKAGQEDDLGKRLSAFCSYIFYNKPNTNTCVGDGENMQAAKATSDAKQEEEAI
jgi:hypothetical protein